MKNFLAVPVVLFMALSGCGGSDANAPKAEAPKVETEGRHVREVTLMVDMEEEKRLQRAFDNGGQRWRGDAADVAHAMLLEQGLNVSRDECEVVEETEDYCVVRTVADEGEIDVRVERRVRPDGIWTATKIKVIETGNEKTP
ncbi:MAG: hypothetical protein V3W31_10185 [Thermodesulfobacteriota bacterium]